jgi:hypothetical protein
VGFRELLVPRLSGTPLVVTGLAAAELARQVAAVLHVLADDDISEPPHVVPGNDPVEILKRATELLRSRPAPAESSVPLLSGHSAH